MGTLADVVLHAMEGYTGKAINGHSYLTRSLDGNLLTVVAVGSLKGERIVNTGLLVRLQGETIIIERDINDKPLVDALMQAGVPRERIVLAYAGEAVETA